MNAADNTVEYATWSHAGSELVVKYAVPVFRDIEFTVSEHFRRIPHGGIENGGLLYGTVTGHQVQVEAFQPIECEHAFGPSFQLSAGDIQNLKRQVREGGSEVPSLVLGWFISHSRSELVLNEAEASLASELFPSSYALTLLIKPERFKSTRFAFLVRNADGVSETDGRENSFILPAPPRAPSRSPRPVQVEETPASPATTRAERVPQPTLASEPLYMPAPFVAAPPTLPAPAPRRRDLFWPVLQLAIVTSLFAAWGFYYAAIPEIIPLEATTHGAIVLVSWPAEQTVNAEFVSIRINGGSMAPLSAVDCASGTTSVRSAGKDLRVELLAHHWLRDARGSIRVVSD